MKIQEVLQELVRKQHRIAVYKDLIEYLEEYLPSDIDPVPEEPLTVDSGTACIEPVVSYSAIESVIEQLSTTLLGEQKELDKLNSTETKSNGKSRKQPAAKRQSRKPKAATGSKRSKS
jgi:hypothetical protein